jgi:predicted lipoprotein with Yx(FWY)xxD motif
MVNHSGASVVSGSVTRLATIVLACLALVLVPGAAADAASRPALKTFGTPIGIVVTGGNHHTVYVFDLDHRGTHRSACTGACLRAWRPVTFAGTAHTRIRAAGITAAVRSIPAAHHRRQVTLAGWPLYYYVGDAAPGDVNGRGSGGVWWPVSPDGSRIKVIPVDPHPLPSGGPAPPPRTGS